MTFAGNNQSSRGKPAIPRQVQLMEVALLALILKKLLRRSNSGKKKRNPGGLR